MNLLFAASLAIASCVAPGCADGDIAPERLAGTERIWPNSSDWISVSPDESLLVFAEIDSTLPPPPEEYIGPTPIHLVTLRLRSGEKTHHRLDDLPPGTVHDQTPGPWLELMWHFDAAGWSDGSFHIERWLTPVTSLNPWISFSSGVESARRVTRPESLRCCDCPPRGLVKKVADGRTVNERSIPTDLEGHLSIAYRDGHASEFLYAHEQNGDGVNLLKLDSQSIAKVVKRVTRLGREATLRRIRVSPNERFLAYVIIVRSKSSIPSGGTEELCIYDQETSSTYMTDGVYTGIGNLIWSGDSKRLYFGATDPSSHAVYRITMPN